MSIFKGYEWWVRIKWVLKCWYVIITWLHSKDLIYIHTYIHTYTYIYIHIYTHIHIYIYTYIHTYTYIYTHTYTHIYIYTHTHIHTGAGHIIRISSKSLFISLITFKKCNLYNVYIHSTQTDIFQVFISFNFDDYNWQQMKTPNSVSQKIWILLKTNTKKGFLEILANWKVWTWKVWACTALNT